MPRSKTTTMATTPSFSTSSSTSSSSEAEEAEASDPPSPPAAAESGPGDWSPSSPADALAASDLGVSPLDPYNADLLNEVRRKSYVNPAPLPLYDLVVIGAGAGGLVSSRQAARRGAKSAMISGGLAGGDCLNAGCVPSKALLRVSRLIREVRRASEPSNEFGVYSGGVGGGGGEVRVDFPRIMERMRRLRSAIAPVDGHARGDALGVQTFQGFGRFVSSDTVEVVVKDGSGAGGGEGEGEGEGEDGDEEGAPPRRTLLKFRRAVIATGGRPSVPSSVPGLDDSPYTTSESLFNLPSLPPRMVILGAGVVGLEMSQAFSAFGSSVTVLQQSDRLMPRADPDAAGTIRDVLEGDGVAFVTGARTTRVETLRRAGEGGEDLPLLKVTVDAADDAGGERTLELECECLLVAAGRLPNVDGMNLEAAGVEYDPRGGVIIDDNARSVTNPDVYAVGDCCAGVPRLTHVSGEMAKLVVQNALFDDDWKVSSLVIPACMYTEPEYATTGVLTAPEDEVDAYTAALEHNDRAILDGDDRHGFVKILCRKGTDTIVGCTIVAPRAGEMINEVTLAIKNGIGLEGIGRNVHSYPTTGEAVMMCGLQLIGSKWERLHDN